MIKYKMPSCLYGQAIGDAMGLGTEFLSKNEVLKVYPNGISKYEDIIQDAHHHRWHKGAWTDDTDMMICIMTAFEDRYFNVHQVARHFKDWFEGEPMDIGDHIYKTLCMSNFEQSKMCSKLWWELSRKHSAANGALMRTSVVGFAPDNVTEQTINLQADPLRPRCIGSCVIATAIIHNLVWNNSELSYNEIKTIGDKYDERIAEWVDIAYHNTYISDLDLDELSSIGYTLRTLSAALILYRKSR